MFGAKQLKPAALEIVMKVALEHTFTWIDVKHREPSMLKYLLGSDFEYRRGVSRTLKRHAFVRTSGGIGLPASLVSTRLLTKQSRR